MCFVYLSLYTKKFETYTKCSWVASLLLDGRNEDVISNFGFIVSLLQIQRNPRCWLNLNDNLSITFLLDDIRFFNTTVTDIYDSPTILLYQGRTLKFSCFDKKFDVYFHGGTNPVKVDKTIKLVSSNFGQYSCGTSEDPKYKHLRYTLKYLLCKVILYIIIQLNEIINYTQLFFINFRRRYQWNVPKLKMRQSVWWSFLCDTQKRLITYRMQSINRKWLRG